MLSWKVTKLLSMANSDRVAFEIVSSITHAKTLSRVQILDLIISRTFEIGPNPLDWNPEWKCMLGRGNVRLEL